MIGAQIYFFFEFSENGDFSTEILLCFQDNFSTRRTFSDSLKFKAGNIGNCSPVLFAATPRR